MEMGPWKRESGENVESIRFDKLWLFARDFNERSAHKK